MDEADLVTRAERLLYHQIHPLKLLTDVTTSFASTWLLWQARWVPALVVAFVPSILVTVLLLRRADLDRLRDSRLGRYVSTFMTRRVEALRFGGQFVMWAGAAAHVPWLVPLGFMIVVFGWLRGLWLPAAQPAPPARAAQPAPPARAAQPAPPAR